MKNYVLFLIISSLCLTMSSCNTKESEKEKIQVQEDGSVIIPLNNIPITTVNMTDQKGLKQGVWQEDDNKGDGAIYYVVKEYNYINDTLNGYYLEYKPKCADTLIFGYYLMGQKHGKWMYWAETENKLENIVEYQNGVIKE